MNNKIIIHIKYMFEEYMKVYELERKLSVFGCLVGKMRYLSKKLFVNIAIAEVK